MTPVTDHAVLRYIERVMGVDVDRIRRTISEAVDGAAKIGVNRVTINGWEFRIKDGTVVTMLSRHSEPEPKKRRR